MADPTISIAGTAKIDAPEPVWLARSQTHLAELSILCADPAVRDRIAIYAGGGKWYMPEGSVYEFFDDGEVHISPHGSNGKHPLTFVISKEIYEGFPEHYGALPTEFQIYQHGYDPDLARRGHPLPSHHFHWVFMSDDLKVPSAVHCSTERFKRDVTTVVIKTCRQTRR